MAIFLEQQHTQVLRILIALLARRRDPGQQSNRASDVPIRHQINEWPIPEDQRDLCLCE